MRRKRIDVDALPASENQACVDMLYSFMRTCASQGTGNVIAEEAGEKMIAAIVAAGTPLVLQFVGGAVYRDKILLPLEFEAFRRAQILVQTVENHGVHEIAFTDVPSLDDLLHFGSALGRGLQGRTDALRRMRFERIRVRALPHLGRRAKQDQGGSVLVDANVALAFEIGEELRGMLTEPWSWSTGIALLRFMETAFKLDPHAASRAVELMPGSWSASRRAVAASVHVAHVLGWLGAPLAARRAAAHTALAVGMHGLGPRGGQPIAEAAEAAIASLTAEPPAARSGIDPHRLRVCSMVHALSKPEPAADEPNILGLVRMAYSLERRRCPEDVSFHLTIADLLALALKMQGRSHYDDWLGALVGAYGIVPMGSFVLCDGRLGVATEPSPDPWRPRVLVQGEKLAPIEPVSIFSPLARARPDV